MTNMCMRLTYGQREREMTKPFNCNMDIDQLMLPNHYEFAFKNLTLDYSRKVKFHLSPCVMIMSNADYNLFMKILYHNIRFDDGCS